MAKKKTETLKRPKCPFCGGQVIGNGYHKSNGDMYKRWKCKSCRKTFSRRFWKRKNRASL